jgi:predicted RNase H-like HicB family nuclease
MQFTVEYEREQDGRWIAEIMELPGVLVYAASPDEALAKAQALALRVLAERLELDAPNGELVSIAFATA